MKTDRLTIGLPYDRRQWHDRDAGSVATSRLTSRAIKRSPVSSTLDQARLPPALLVYDRSGDGSMSRGVLHALTTSVSGIDCRVNSTGSNCRGCGGCRGHENLEAAIAYAGRSLELSRDHYDDTETQTPVAPRPTQRPSKCSLQFQLAQVRRYYKVTSH